MSSFVLFSILRNLFYLIQIVATEGFNPSKNQLYQAFPGLSNHSHSMVAGGLLVMS